MTKEFVYKQNQFVLNSYISSYFQKSTHRIAWYITRIIPNPTKNIVISRPSWSTLSKTFLIWLSTETFEFIFAFLYNYFYDKFG